jgi:hypothetical protein
MSLRAVILSESVTQLKMRKRQQDILKHRAKFKELYPTVAAKHQFAGGRRQQTYIQMHASMRPALHSGKKRCTRRTWGPSKQQVQERAFLNKALVAVTGQGHCSTIGYVLYSSMSTSTVGTVLTPADLDAEGGTATSDAEFRARWYKTMGTGSDPSVMLPDATPVHVLTFKFYSIVSQ